MGWADHYIAALKDGKTVQFRPRGRSMEGKIGNGDLVMVAPLNLDPVAGDIVLCQVKGAQYLHLVKAVEWHGLGSSRFLIGNNRGKINGWTPRAQVFGKVVSIEY